MSVTQVGGTTGGRLADYARLCKPKVVSLVVFTAAVGMALAAPVAETALVDAVGALVGIFFVASSAAAFNCLLERRIDAKMGRTRARPLASGRLLPGEAAVVATTLATGGLWLLHLCANPLAMWLTAATFLGYALIYSALLKPLTPQNIVIGGLSGAMPPVLGWAAVAGEVGVEAIQLALIIFVWTPPHFWALALYRSEDYRRAGLPMLPVTHGPAFTRLQIFLYATILVAVSLMPFASGTAGWIYLIAAAAANARFLWLSFVVWRRFSDRVARALFSYSITYLAAIFAALVADAYVPALFN